MVGGGNSKSDISFAGTYASSAFAACFAEKVAIASLSERSRFSFKFQIMNMDGRFIILILPLPFC